ncbi:MAG: hypothetical protein ACNYPE_08855 [Candidatus Azotimanducaceae bacterium WSBS_2022_MAG_OTU7]
MAQAFDGVFGGKEAGVGGKAMHVNYSEARYRVRGDIPEAHRLIWQMIAKPGNWWRGEDSVRRLN